MVVDRVDGERIGLAAGGLEQHDPLILVGHFGGDAEQGGEADQRHAAAADGGDLGRADAVDADRADPQDLVDRRARHGEDLAAGADRERGDDGERERHADAEPDALPRPGIDVDHAADPLDIGADHVHADAAAGNGGDLLGGGKARA